MSARNPTQLEREVLKQCDIIDANPGEEWEHRSAALLVLADIFRAQVGCENDAEVWSSSLFRIMRLPIQRQIKDLRSQIVKEVGEMLVAMSVSAKDALAPFIRELTPALMETVNSGNKVIVGHADEAIQQILLNTRVKKSIATLVRNMSSKSTQLRETCSNYFVIILQNWGRSYLASEAAGLTEAVGKMLGDPSQYVRMVGRNIFAEFEKLFPDRAGELTSKMDARTLRNLQNASRDVTADDLRGRTGSTRDLRGARAPSPSPRKLDLRSRSSANDVRSQQRARSMSRTRSTASTSHMLSPGSSSSHHSPGGSGGRSTRGAHAPRHRGSITSLVDDDMESVETLSMKDSVLSAADSPLPEGIVIGYRVKVNLKDLSLDGVVRFVGETSFASGSWVGVELHTPQGKNDGSVAGKRYFQCSPNHGLFVRPNQLSVIPTEAPVAAAMNGSGGSSEEWQTLGGKILLEHKKHIDTILSQMRDEMTLLADFERMQADLNEERVRTYFNSVWSNIEHRDDLSRQFRAAIENLTKPLGLHANGASGAAASD
mmetsp:Transcript_22714/g.66122  ORF Transcript_22714/g.66122 Transcript_22714/m.66122 type:complete len:544 (-) Transcript_22714:531-2162(-)